MKMLTLILGCLMLAALLGAILMTAPATLRQTLRRACGIGPAVHLEINALGDGIHCDGKVGHLLSDAALTTRHLLVKRGSDAAHFAACGASDKPLGICQDEPDAAEVAANVALLGAISGTVRMVGSEAIAVDADVYTAASGKVQDLPAGAGTYYRVGRAFTACSADGDTFEVVPCLPTATIVS